jgi:hypothetical protein
MIAEQQGGLTAATKTMKSGGGNQLPYADQKNKQGKMLPRDESLGMDERMVIFATLGGCVT